MINFFFFIFLNFSFGFRNLRLDCWLQLLLTIDREYREWLITLTILRVKRRLFKIQLILHGADDCSLITECFSDTHDLLGTGIKFGSPYY